MIGYDENDFLFVQSSSLEVMSQTALRDLNTIPGSEKKNESSSKGSFTKPYVGNANENLEEFQKKNSASVVSPPVNGNETANTVLETGNSEVEYIESENLDDLEDVDMSLKVLLLLFFCLFYMDILIYGG
jgi:hypothetical protein